ncbi:hypothetical protein BU16DRAFT_622362 [Lophium mytilinum]|uniref:Uncharacterized protein n=1 Tax=Lophium mytilinum TaxID=390894 RepID=A0A6A6QCE6_9PEZI|nr:hypothetical protein BU16DRAFT_622362 [Lophium mytilinum]
MSVSDNFAEHAQKLRKALTSAMQNRKPTGRRHATKVNCTHIEMDRIFGYQQCQSCGRFPSFGWLYMCRQDEREAEPLPFNDSILKNDSSIESLARADLEDIGVSKSIVENAEKGGYTVEQLHRIKAQKLRLNEVVSIADRFRCENESPQTKELVELGTNTEGHKRKDSGVDRPSSENDPPPMTNDSTENQQSQDEIFPLPQPAPSTSTSLNELDPTLKRIITIPPPCQMKVCHSCRPFYKDRIYISFGAVLANEVPPLTTEEAKDLPVVSAEIVRNIGLRPRQHRLLSEEFYASFDSQYTITTTHSEQEDLHILRQGPRDFYKLGSGPSNELKREFQKISLRSSLMQAFNSLFRPSRDPSSDGSTITLPLARTGRHRGGWTDETDDFDLGSLKRVRSHRRLVIEQESSRTTSGFTSDISEDDHLDASSSDAYSEYSSLSEGSEVEVDGGVALTEESVEKHIPDILTEDEEQIMTQV